MELHSGRWQEPGDFLGTPTLRMSILEIHLGVSINGGYPGPIAVDGFQWNTYPF